MIKYVFGLMLIVSFIVTFASDRQSSGFPNSISVTNLDGGVSGVCLSISLTTNLLHRSVEEVLNAEVKNLSGSTISWAEQSPRWDFLVELIDKRGNSRRITAEPPPRVFRNMYREVGSGQTQKWAIPLTISKAIDPGNYSVIATREFNMGGRNIKLVSNSLAVEIK